MGRTTLAIPIAAAATASSENINRWRSVTRAASTAPNGSALLQPAQTGHVPCEYFGTRLAAPQFRQRTLKLSIFPLRSAGESKILTSSWCTSVFRRGCARLLNRRRKTSESGETEESIYFECRAGFAVIPLKVVKLSAGARQT